ncbi:hypothetical protein LCGC14_0767130 [marine sediment metagenome]|uniref:Uncharacterized protein n=1 Tax=marine sediment metagenome TaxID=412755 RepID=A0A0F9T6E6_9ZZZZ
MTEPVSVLKTGKLPPLIDNENYFMKNVLKLIFRKWAKRAKIAVGYFFATAFDNVEEELENLDKVQVIMGQETNRMTKEELKIGDSGRQIIEQGYSKDDVLKDVSKHIDEINSEDELVRLDALIKGMIDGKIEVRVRVIENGIFHPKVYWFDCPERGGDIAIVGSHNLSKNAQEGNEEASSVIVDRFYTDAWQEWFDKKWEQSEQFSETLIKLIQENKKYRNFKKKQKKEAEKKKEAEEKEEKLPYQYLPPVQFFKVLFKTLEKDYLLERDDVLIPFQKIDYNLCKDTLQKFGGVILADTVGLGKSFIAARLIKDYYDRGQKYLLVVPPNTMDQWLDYLSIFDIPAKKGENIISMYQISQETFPEDEYKDFDVVVVDESHNFRNRASNRWRNFIDRIKNRRADYILLTATPINNRFEDLYAQVSMFENERFKNEELLNLYKDFEKFVRGDEKDLTLLDSIKTLRRKLIVRTTRRDLKRLYKEIIIPRGGKVDIKDPIILPPCYYEFSNLAYKDLFKDFIPNFIQKLKLPHISILNPSAAKNLHGLYKILLYKRMESSIFSLYRSIENLEAKNLRLIGLLNEKDLDEIRELEKKEYKKELEDAEQIELSAIESFIDVDFELKEIDEKTDKEGFLKAIQYDMEIIKNFKEILERLRDSEYFFKDDKVGMIKEFVRKNRDKKILVFSEYSDTAEYLFENIMDISDDDFIIRCVTGGTKNKIYEAIQFSPSSYSDKLKKEVGKKLRVQIGPPYTNLLISTDTLSEGVNLQEADIVINYDLPWNPVKIIQRIGRANRIGSTKEVYVINYLPEDNINREVELIETLQEKIENIIQIIGAEHSILSPDEMVLIQQHEADEIELFRKKRELVANLELDELEEESERTKLSALDQYLLDIAEKIPIKKHDLDGVEFPAKIPYTILSSVKGYAILHLYGLIVGSEKYYEYQIKGESIIEDKIPSSKDFQSPRYLLIDEDLQRLEEFKNTILNEIVMARRRTQREVFNIELQKAKGNLIEKLKGLSKHSILKVAEPGFCKKISDISSKIDTLSIPSRFTRRLQMFRTKWFRDNDCTAQRKTFLTELKELEEELSPSSEVITSTESITAAYVAFTIYDKLD